MGMIASLFNPPKPAKTPLVKPLPQNAGKAEDALRAQATATGGNNSSILTSPLGVGDNTSAATSLLGT